MLLKNHKAISVYLSQCFLIFFLLFSHFSFAISLQPVVTFDEKSEIDFNWQKIVAYPKTSQQFLIFNANGKIKKIKKGKALKVPFFDLSAAIKINNIHLSAISFHPSFTLKDQVGYGIIYTAHQEPANKSTRITKIPKKTTDIENSYDLVITEWQVGNKHKTLNPDSKREIIRISSPDKSMLIQQLSFNKYIKPWNNNFGELFITINQSEAYKHIPLYSGIVLAIKPEKFGLRNYTIPTTNPFLTNDEINNEIVLLGAQNIEAIIWQKNKIDEWFLIRTDNQDRTLSFVNMGDDLSKKTTKTLWKNKVYAPLNNLVLYEGRKLNDLLFKFIFVSYSGEKWQLNSLTIDNNNEAIETNLTPLTYTNKNDELGLISDGNRELILLDKTSGVFNLITSIIGDSAEKQTLIDEPSIEQPKNTFDFLWVLLLIPLSVLIAIYLYYKPRELAKDKKSLNKYYARFELQNNNSHIALFKRHQMEPHITLPIEHIINSAIYLNNNKINEINSSKTFDEETSKQMQHTFSLEQRHKMVDRRIRNISIKLIDNNNKKFTICLYLRRGNQRYTRIHYQDCLRMINDWCSLYSEKFNK